MLSLFGLDPGTYAPSALHDPHRTFPETNCYVDIWIELLHAQGIDPASMMSFAAMVEFEGDQWTFFKPPPEQLLRLYGIDVHEMQFYRPVLDHVALQLRLGRSVLVEADSFYLPDTAATSYRRGHVKSSIAIEAIDLAGERLRYFHGAGYHELHGEDYRGVFRLGRVFSDDVLPPYVEVARFDAGPRLTGEELRSAARDILREQLERKPQTNPWKVFAERLTRDLPELLRGDDRDYHAYAFATVRQCGAAFDSARSFVDWLEPENQHAHEASEALGRQVSGAKALLFRLARRRQFDPTATLAELAAAWETAMQGLEQLSCRAACGAV
jgi:hypothetical protein